jgi:hypothetical protein
MGWMVIANGYGLSASAGAAGVVVVTGVIKTEAGDYLQFED